MRSKGSSSPYKSEIQGKCPMQPRATRNVTNLDKDENFLVVFVNKCDHLPPMDETGASDPYLRVSWDNMVQRSMTLRGTLKPVFNAFFFFPVRMFNKKISDVKYRKNALQYELASK